MKSTVREKALELWREGTDQLLSGDVDGAIDTFTESLSLAETAEGYTFRGWAYSFQGRFEEAIAECERAIEADPTFGNPYNDIGSYLVQQGKLDEAVEWFEKAKGAVRYESRHFPYLNLGRLFLFRGEVADAISEFQEALAIAPADEVARDYLERLKYSVN